MHPGVVRAWLAGLDYTVLVDLAVASQRAMSHAGWINAAVCAAAAEASVRDDHASCVVDKEAVAAELTDSALRERHERSAHVADLALACGLTGHAI